MLSRRSVRVKVMQLLYSMISDENLTIEVARQRYWKMIDGSYELFQFTLYVFLQITKVAEEDEAKRKAKHLPTVEDKSFSAKICNNELIRSLRDNNDLIKAFEKKGFASKFDKDHATKIYNEFAKEEAYKAYIQSDSTREDHIEILLELFRFCRKSELFNEAIGDQYMNWIDDKSLVIGVIKKVIKVLPMDSISTLDSYYPDDETVKTYGENLLNKTFLGEEALLAVIKPILKNWDHERLALVDMLLLKMATCEMLEFETIPAKVTLNEYVEVAKSYSTDKSKEFVNGVLDKLMKQFETEGKLKKEGRGLED